MNWETTSKQRKNVLIAAAVGLICMFLPWWSLGSFGYGKLSGNGMNGWGVVVFICFLVAGGLCLMGDQTKNLSRTNWMIVIIAGAVATLIMVILFLRSTDQLSLLQYGFYGAFSASIAVLLLAYNNRSADDSLQSGFDSLKGSLGAKMNATPNNPSGTNPNNPGTPNP